MTGLGVCGSLSIILGVVAAATGCAGSRSVAGIELGKAVAPGDARFAPPEDRRVALRQPPAFEGRPARAVEARLDDRGAVEAVEISFDAERAEVGALESWARQLCGRMGGKIDEFTPSPLGTPEPGEDWDPVITTNVTCDGAYRGYAARVHFSRSRASDFENAQVTVTVRRAPPKRRAAPSEDEHGAEE